jgi:folate-binding protein YgfZ
MNTELYERIVAGDAVVFPLAARSLWKLTGPDATRYLNGQVTNDVAGLAEGHALYAAVCTAKGRMEGDVTIAKHGEEFDLDADPSLRESLGTRLDKFLIADDAVFEDISEAWSVCHVFGVNRPEAPSGGFIIANARFGEPGHDVWTPGQEAMESAPPDNAKAVDIVRIENGIPRWGAELTANTLPPEAGPHMLNAISYTKGCYVGQETIARLKSVGHVNKTLVFLLSESAEFPAPGGKLTHERREVGTVTSSGFSPRHRKGIGLAYVQRQHATDGAVLKADGLGMTITPSGHGK